MAEYNTEPSKLVASIQSMLDQTVRDFELIIIDDGGSNDVEEIVSQFNDSRIRVIKNDRNRGLPYSLNRAIDESSTEILVRMDTDDVSVPTRLEKQLAFLEGHPEYAVVGSRVNQIADGEIAGSTKAAGEKLPRDVMRGNSLFHPSTVMRKSAVLEVGGYPDRKRAEDLALWCELLLAGFRLYEMDDILLNYRVDFSDYKKRSLKHRKGEIQTRLYYYPKLKAGPREYLKIVQSIVAGLAPPRLAQAYRHRFGLKK
ncbi:glycosyltransferase [Corynebacterium sp. S7]